jgi:hypothetical protein
MVKQGRYERPCLALLVCGLRVQPLYSTMFYVLNEDMGHEPKTLVVHVMDRPHSCALWFVCDVFNFEIGDIEVTLSADQLRAYERLFQPGHILKISGELYEDHSFALETAEFQRER